MGLIKVLSENLVNQIAAGEVVERPASVVKELVENSLDAGADLVSVEVKNAGMTFIKITDNGCGMSREDAEMALQRHATSKISEEADLWKIGTMGFRGEALASISSVSKVTLKTKLVKDLSGTEIHVDGGKPVTVKDIGMSDGTCLEVYNLFFNTPARQKYLKKESTELGHITSTLNTIALAHPGVAFKLVHNGKVVFDLARVTDLESRVADIFGKATSEAMLPIFYGGSEVKIHGFVGKPAISRSSSKHQYIFVNNRPIQHHLLAFTVKRAFHSMLMENKKPVFVMNISIDPGLIDVNVHPRKLEVRFEDEQGLMSIVYGMMKSALEKYDLTPKGFTESGRYMADKFPEKDSAKVPSASLSENFDPRVANRTLRSKFSDRLASGTSAKSSGTVIFNDNRKPSSGSIQDALDFSKSILAERESRDLEKINGDSAGLQVVSQVSNSYIVAQNEEGLVLIDQHAAHERVRYEELMDQFENQKKSVQPLLMPLTFELTRDEIALIDENKGVFDELGFEIESFGGNSFIIHAVPSFLSDEDAEGVVKGVLDDIINEKNPSKFQGKTEEIINYMSCRSAIKFGQKLSTSEMQSLINQMESLKRPYTCPHGRPTMISLTLSELEKMFGRK